MYTKSAPKIFKSLKVSSVHEKLAVQSSGI